MDISLETHWNDDADYEKHQNFINHLTEKLTPDEIKMLDKVLSHQYYVGQLDAWEDLT